MSEEFKSALLKAQLELSQIEAEQRRLAQRKAQLLQTITALAPLLTTQPNPQTLRLADAIRVVIGSAAMRDPQTVFTTKMVRTFLDEMGFDFSEYHENHMAAIHTAMRRMWKAGELIPAGDVDFGGGYRWAANEPHPGAAQIARLLMGKTIGQRVSAKDSAYTSGMRGSEKPKK